MSTARPLPLLLQIVLVLPVAFVAGWLGSQFASSPETPYDRDARPTLDAATRDHLIELERRSEVADQRIEAAERQFAALGDKLEDLTVRIENLERRPTAVVAASTEPENVAATTAEPLAAVEQAQFENIQKAVAKQLVATQTQFLGLQMRLFADATEGGADKRRGQAIVEASVAERDYGGDREELREIYLAHWSRAASEIGPLVTRGLEQADRELVRDRYLALLEETDAKVAQLLEGKRKETWVEDRAKHRRLMDDILSRRPAGTDESR